jgi:hypothetical protein
VRYDVPRFDGVRRRDRGGPHGHHEAHVVTRIAFAIACAATLAYAEPIARGDVSDPPPKTTWSRLGTRLGFGLVPRDGYQSTISISVSLDHPVSRNWRLLGEYEYLWIGPRDADQMDLGVAALPDSGHRLNAGVRRRLGSKSFVFDHFAFWIDVEGGAGMMLVAREMDSIWLPHAFVGTRVGMDLRADRRIWEYEILLRGLLVPDGVGVLFGIGLVWGE